MTRFDPLNRVIIASALVAVAVVLGIWLARSPLTVPPAAAPAKIAPEPILAPPPAPIHPATTVIQVPVEVEVPPEPPAVTQAEPRPEPQPTCQPRRRGLFRRRRPA